MFSRGQAMGRVRVLDVVMVIFDGGKITDAFTADGAHAYRVGAR